MLASQYRHIGLSVKTHIGATLLLTTKVKFLPGDQEQGDSHC